MTNTHLMVLMRIVASGIRALPGFACIPNVGIGVLQVCIIHAGNEPSTVFEESSGIFGHTDWR